MDVIYPDQGLLPVLHEIANDGTGKVFHWYGNDFTPDQDTVLSDLVGMDSVFPPISVPDSDFVFEQVTQHVAAIQAANISQPNTSGVSQTVYGWYSTDASGTYLFQAARYDGAPIVVPNGQVVIITPIIGGYSGNA